ncbi:MAG: diheme cytochrome c-553 [Ferruginibacter sp.]|nr:diheme cytochrome c-553 [Ferruginibacter sp.]
MMRKTILTIFIIAATITTGIVSCDTGKANKPSASTVSNDSLVKRGGYLVTIGGCDDCHSPKKFGPHGPEVDMDRRLSGFPASRSYPKYDSNVVKKGLVMFNEDLTSAAGPWGVSFAANLTSDDTGLGNWSEAHFFKAIREGKFKGLDGSRTLLPPMPWENFRKMTDDDLKAVFAFLKSTKPVKNIVPGTRQLAELK